MVLCPTKWVVASYWFSAANTGASASRECSSCDGVGSLTFMYTTKWVFAVKRDIGIAWQIESVRWHCPRGIVLLPVVDMNIRLPYNLIWKKDNSSPLVHKFVDQVEADKTTPQRPEGDSTQLFGQPVPVTSQSMSQFSHASHIADPHAQGSDMSSRRLS